MPDMSLEEALQEAYASAPSIPVLETLEIRHPSFTSPIRVVRDHADLTCFLESDAPLDPGGEVTFIALGFDLTLPEISKSGVSDIEISIDNVGGEIIGYLDAAAQTSSVIEVTYRPYLASDLSQPMMLPPQTFVVRDVSADVFRIRAKAGFSDISNKKFPSDTYNGERFPGMPV